MANFEAFHQVISSSINLLFLKSAHLYIIFLHYFSIFSLYSTVFIFKVRIFATPQVNWVHAHCSELYVYKWEDIASGTISIVSPNLITVYLSDRIPLCLFFKISSRYTLQTVQYKPLTLKLTYHKRAILGCSRIQGCPLLFLIGREKFYAVS